MRWFVLATVVMLSGCLGGGTPDGEDPSAAEPVERTDATDGPAGGAPDAPEAAPRNPGAPGPGDGAVATRVTYRLQATWGAEAAVFLTGPMEDPGRSRLEFPVLPGAARLETEVRWDDPVQDLDLWLSAPACHGSDSLEEVLECFASRTARDGSQGQYADRDGHVGAPDAPARVAVDGDGLSAFGCAAVDGDCTWTLFPNNKDASVGLAFEAVAVVTYPGGVPAEAVVDGAELS